jgi:hypothetical protein
MRTDYDRICYEFYKRILSNRVSIAARLRNGPIAIGFRCERKLSPMMFTKRLRDGVRRGDITCSVRIWKTPRVRVGGRYRMEEGEIEVNSIEPIGFPDITPELARASGFLGVLDLLKVARHGRGEKIYLVRFHYIAPSRSKHRA